MRIGQDFNKRDLQMDIPKDMKPDELRQMGVSGLLEALPVLRRRRR